LHLSLILERIFERIYYFSSKDTTFCGGRVTPAPCDLGNPMPGVTPVELLNKPFGIFRASLFLANE